jgi:ParB-like chromosome segregation protein Spo0J
VEYVETLRSVPLTDLERFPGNARKHATAQLRKSVRLGQYKSLLVRRRDDGQLVIVAGNGTADAMEAENITHAQVEVWNYTDKEARSVNVRDNHLSDLATDDQEALAALLELQDGEYEGLGYTDQEIAKILGREPMPEPGDGDTDGQDSQRWGLIVECGSEEEQVALLDDLIGKGLNVRAIMA